jgi:cytochrome c556
MLRKWMILAASMVGVTVVTVGITSADDEDSPLHKIMEQVNKHNLAITKGVRTAVAYKKAQKDVATSAEELVKLSKEARTHGKDVIKKAKDVPDADKKWNELMASFTSSAQNLAQVAAKSSATQADAKSAHTALKKVCTECHNVFRIEEEGF